MERRRLGEVEEEGEEEAEEEADLEVEVEVNGEEAVVGEEEVGVGDLEEVEVEEEEVGVGEVGDLVGEAGREGEASRLNKTAQAKNKLNPILLRFPSQFMEKFIYLCFCTNPKISSSLNETTLTRNFFCTGMNDLNEYVVQSYFSSQECQPLSEMVSGRTFASLFPQRSSKSDQPGTFSRL
jgi:hypothetical protein